MERYIIVDLETTGHSPKTGDNIIEIGIVVVEKNKIIETFTTFINPERDIPTFITNLTNISNKDVKDAPTFRDKQSEIASFFDEGIFIAHNVDFDYDFLNVAFSMNGKEPLHNAVIDTVELARILFPQAPGFKLEQLAAYLNIEHTNPHRALSDAYVTAKLFLLMKEKLADLPLETIQQLLRLEPYLKSDLFPLLQKFYRSQRLHLKRQQQMITFHGIAFRHQEDDSKKNTVDIPSFGEFLDEIYEEDGDLTHFLPQYEKRMGQRDMSETIFRAFNEKRHALIEAGTGTGKSLAYLITALYEAVVSNERIVISTYTTQLQTQLLEEEIPLVRKIIPFPFNVTILKGKQHYISLEKFHNELQHVSERHYGEILTMAMILVWLTETITGDIEEIHLPSSGYDFYRKVSAEAEGATDPNSPWFPFDFYQKARKKAQKAHLIITNHALLCTDLFHTKQIPNYQKAIIDEAHHLEDAASSNYGLQLDYMQTVFLLHQIGTSDGNKWLDKVISTYPNLSLQIPLHKWDKLFTQAKTDLDELFRFLYQYVLKQNKRNKMFSDVGRMQLSLDPNQWGEDNWLHITEMIGRISMSLNEMATILQNIANGQPKHSHLFDKTSYFQKKLDEIKRRLVDLFQLEDSKQFKWIEIETSGAKNAVYVFSEPKEIGTTLKNHLFEKKVSIILTSATLTTKDSFSFVEKRLGLSSDKTIKELVPSPFDYENQVQLLVPNDFPDIRQQRQDEFLYATCEAILSLAEITKGRMLVLFTSYDMLRKSYDLLRELMDENYVLIGQGITSGSRMRLKKKFQTFEKAILLGTNSFWEGIDIPGESLSSLVIVRLPFQPPNQPTYKAKAELCEQNGENPFFHLALPHAIIRFKQGFGRLIRSKDDRGIIFVCDARIKKSRYGSQFIKSIPNVPIHYDSTKSLIKLAKDWF